MRWTGCETGLRESNCKRTWGTRRSVGPRPRTIRLLLLGGLREMWSKNNFPRSWGDSEGGGVNMFLTTAGRWGVVV